MSFIRQRIFGNNKIWWRSRIYLILARNKVVWGDQTYEERNVCPAKLIPMKEKMGKIGKKLWSQGRGEWDRGWLLFGWRTKWIWIEMRKTADRNWDWGAFSLEHTTIENGILPKEEENVHFWYSKKNCWETVWFYFCWFLSDQELKSSVLEGNDHLYLLRCLDGGSSSWYKIPLTIYNVPSCMLHGQSLNNIYMGWIWRF